MFYRPSLLNPCSVSLFRILWIGLFGCLLARTGNLMISQPVAAAPASPTGTFQLVDNFDSSALGALNGQNGWQATTGINVVGDPANFLNQVVEVTAGGAQAYKALPTVISDVNTGTLHFRLRRNGHIDGFAGLSDLATPNDWSSYETQFGAQSTHAADAFIVRDGSQFEALGNHFADQTWYCVWLVANNTNNSYQVYAQGGALTTPTQLDAAGQTTFSFRNGGSDALLTFLARMDTTRSQGSFYIDDIYVDPTVQNLTSPGSNCGALPIDTTPPVVNWIAPVANDGVYEVACSAVVLLDVTATDASGVNRVEFSRWDAVNNVVVPIGVAHSTPYQATIDSCVLNMDWNEIDADVFDNIGNRQRTNIWLYRITAPPVAEFDAWPLSGDAPLTVSMHLVSTDRITSCTWRYGDGATGNSCASYHEHIYAAPGNYTVELTVSGPGGSDTRIRNNYITVAVPTVQFGAAAYTVNENEGAAIIYVTLDRGSDQTVRVNYATSNGTATAGSDYTATSGTIIFVGGQTTASFTVPILDDSIDEPGTETVNLSLSNPTNATLGTPANAILTIVDNDDPLPSAPLANFSANVTTGVKPLTIQFNDQSTGTVNSWSWTFGDGGTSNQQNPSHTYNNAGDFTVSLTVTGPGGANTKTMPGAIHVTLPLPAPPTLSTITNGDQKGDYTVAWSASANATSYELQEQHNSGTWTTIYTGANTSRNLAGKSDGTWCYRIRATNTSGPSHWSSSQCTTVVTPVTPPTAPVLSAIANQAADNHYTVSWNNPAGATTYELQEQLDGGSWTTVYTGATPSYRVTGKSSGHWCYQVRASNRGGNSNWSASRCITIVIANAQPVLSLSGQPSTAPGKSVVVRIMYDANANSISSLLFSIDYDHTRLSADRDGDGIVDVVQFRNDLPSSVIKSVAFDAGDTDGELDFTIADFAALPKTLPNGVLAEITFFVLPTITPPSEAAVRFPVASFGSLIGDVPGVTEDGVVSIVQPTEEIYLPLIAR